MQDLFALEEAAGFSSLSGSGSGLPDVQHTRAHTYKYRHLYTHMVSFCFCC